MYLADYQTIISLYNYCHVLRKKLLSLLAVISLGVLVLASCSKDDDPKDNDLLSELTKEELAIQMAMNQFLIMMEVLLWLK